MNGRRLTARPACRMSRALRFGHLVAMLAGASGTPACEASHPVAEHPTWVDVEPILRADCLQCHGGSADLTGGVTGATYRFDFYDLTPEICGEAAGAIDTTTLAGASAALIATSITSVDGTTRPRMPPAPSPALADWEWQTILPWTDLPQKGTRPENQAPVLRIASLSRTADKALDYSVIVEDPEGQSAVGVLTIGSFRLKMNRPGAFAGAIDTSSWPEGEAAVQAVVCDGWTNAAYTLGTIVITHQ